ncbi:DUF418 domain-containing protein [Solibacillus sp. A46]|uniref:DUF418 domain-containing protein n=1 Tax=Solibacillus faecavium TaxID=2762221 RepID=A0ABR8Y3M2_9BACL|nr:DUF418 domain-containing protein [Solibacillus faecavium]MBD8038708.1 DUF418 domain-containing protein [Solibacillus faecavium]
MQKKRIDQLDALRGISLLGILLVNMLIFQYGILGKDQLIYFTDSNTDIWTRNLIYILIEGSFLPIFTFLLGYSLVLYRRSSNTIRPSKIILKRSIGLLLIGFLHFLFIWEGDILFSYGLTTLFLLMFIKRKPHTILIWALIFLGTISLFSYGSYNQSALDPNKISSYILNTEEVYSNGHYSEILQHRLESEALTKVLGLDIEGMGTFILILTTLVSPFTLLPMALLGIYAAKMKFYKINPRYYYIGILLIPIGIVMKLLYLQYPNNDLYGMTFTLGSNFLGIGYISLLFSIYPYLKLINPYLIATGRLSLSNYIAYSIIFTFIFYGYGLGLFGKIGVLNGVIITFVVYVFLAILSKLYLKKWDNGPMEILLKKFINIGEKRKFESELSTKTSS